MTKLKAILYCGGVGSILTLLAFELHSAAMLPVCIGAIVVMSAWFIAHRGACSPLLVAAGLISGWFEFFASSGGSHIIIMYLGTLALISPSSGAPTRQPRFLIFALLLGATGFGVASLILAGSMQVSTATITQVLSPVGVIMTCTGFYFLFTALPIERSLHSHIFVTLIILGITECGRTLVLQEQFYMSAGQFAGITPAILAHTVLTALLLVLASLYRGFRRSDSILQRLSVILSIVLTLTEASSWVPSLITLPEFTGNYTTAGACLGALCGLMVGSKKAIYVAPLAKWERIARYAMTICLVGFVASVSNVCYSAHHRAQSLSVHPPSSLSYSVHSSLILALLSAEDILFFQHRGIDLARLKRVALQTIQSGQYTRGGSTLSMQLAKILYLPYEKNITRKIQQLYLALLLEALYSKEQLLAWYLEVVPLSPTTQGIFDGSVHYYGKPPLDLSVQQEVRLILTIPDPSQYSPSIPLNHRGFDKRALSLVRTMRSFESSLSSSIAALSFVVSDP